VKSHPLPFRSLQRFAFRCCLRKVGLPALLLLCLASPAKAQNPQPNVPPAERSTFEDINRELAQGQVLLDNNDPRATLILRPLAERALASLNAYVGADVLAKPTGPVATPASPAIDGALASATRQTAQAHYLWGVAADRAAQRDVAITALSRALRLAGNPQYANNFLAREALFSLSGIMREGLPLVAPDDALETIARTVHGAMWEPRRFPFELPAALRPPSLEPNDATAKSDGKRELLITAGRVYPALDTSVSALQVITTGGGLARIPPMYRAVAPDALPRVLQLDRMVVGYIRETEGANKGLWQQVVRVYFPSPFLTRNARDDQARAEALSIQFLKVYAMTKAGMGLTNPYAADGVTSIWLSEVSALWPKDDDDPNIRTALGLVMPPLNTPTTGDEEREIEAKPLQKPWFAAGQVDSAPGEIMFFKMTEPRDDSEWLRQIVHEYGHISFPAIGGFRAPLEPYGNGEVGEAIGMLWASTIEPSRLQPHTGKGATLGPGDSEAVFSADLKAHVASVAVPTLRHWNNTGPNSALVRNGENSGLDYLKGLAVYIERVYGAPLLGVASKPLVEVAAAAPDSQSRLTALNTASLLNGLPQAMREPFAPGDKTLPIWLGGALELPTITLTPDELAQRAPRRMKAGERVVAWLYVPPTAASLTIPWRHALPTATGPLKVGGDWKTTAVAAPSGADGALRIDFGPRSGWQRFAFIPSADVVVQNAWFERAATKPGIG